jgi:hypothetical protein
LKCNRAIDIFIKAAHICAMTGAPSKQSAGYSYAEVESALARLFRVPTPFQGSFRARLRHLQRIGMLEVAPGKGRRITYTRDQTTEWMLALLLAQLGVDPIVVVKSIQAERRRLRGWIGEASDAEALDGNEVFLEAHPALMSGAWASRQSAGILRFEKFRQWMTHKPPPVGSIAPPSSGGPQHVMADHRIDAQGFATGPADLGAAELREDSVLGRVDPLLLLINLTLPVRALGTTLQAGRTESAGETAARKIR